MTASPEAVKAAERERMRWTDWLASIAFGIDFSTESPPPCTLGDLGDAMYRADSSEAPDTWAWCVVENTGQAFRGDIE